jgi:hypothetical protein
VSLFALPFVTPPAGNTYSQLIAYARHARPSPAGVHGDDQPLQFRSVAAACAGPVLLIRLLRNHATGEPNTSHRSEEPTRSDAIRANVTSATKPGSERFSDHSLAVDTEIRHPWPSWGNWQERFDKIFRRSAMLGARSCER